VAKGRNLLLQVDISGTMTTIGALRSKTVTINNETIEITNLDSNDWRELNPNGLGSRTISASGSGVFTGDAAAKFIEDACFNRDILSMQIVFENSDVLSGNFAVTSFVRGGEHTAEETVSISLEGSGEFTMTRIPIHCIGALTADTWVAQTIGDFTGSTNYLNGIASDLAGLWVAVSNLGYIGSSVDGGDWVTRFFDVTISIHDVEYANSTWVACGQNHIYYSSDGLSWTKVFVASAVFHKVTYNDGVWVIVGTGNNIYRSTDDGVSWTQATTVPAGVGTFHSIAYGGGVWAVGKADGTILTSTDDGDTWVANSTPFDVIAIQGMAYGQSKFVAANGNGQIGSSSNGVDWVIDGTGYGFANDLIFSPVGLWILAGFTNGKELYHSTDGTSWTLVTGVLGATNNVVSVGFDCAGALLAVGSSDAFVGAKISKSTA